MPDMGLDPWECDECGALVARWMKPKHKDEHNALIEALGLLLMGQQLLLKLITVRTTKVEEE